MTSAQLISPESYPQMLSKQDAANAMKTLQSATTAIKAQGAMEASVPPMHAAILEHVAALEAAGTDMTQVFEQVHEIRGFAETAKLITAGRIADGLCRYMDEMLRIAQPMDAQLVALHVAAIARAARAGDEGEKTGGIVAGELAALVSRRLQDAAKA